MGEENKFYHNLNESQRKIYNQSRIMAREYYGIYGNRNLVLHHKDETLRHTNVDRYILWLPDDLVVVSKSEHHKYHSVGEKNGFYGKHHTQELIEKSRQAHIGKPLTEECKRKISEANKGRVIPPDVRKKMSENNARVWSGITGDNHPCSKAVLGIDKEGNIVVRYGSSQDAVKDGHNQGHICECCRGERKKHHGLKWVWEKDYTKTEEVIECQSETTLWQWQENGNVTQMSLSLP